MCFVPQTKFLQILANNFIFKMFYMASSRVTEDNLTSFQCILGLFTTKFKPSEISAKEKKIFFKQNTILDVFFLPKDLISTVRYILTKCLRIVYLI
jgi:hypothetical protein